MPRDQYFLSQRSALETYLTIGIEAAIWPLSCIGETTDIARQEKKTLRWLVVADLVWSKYADPPVDGGCADVVDKGAEIKGPDLQVFVGDHLKLGHKHISRFRFFRSKNSSKHRISRSQLKGFHLSPPLLHFTALERDIDAGVSRGVGDGERLWLRALLWSRDHKGELVVDDGVHLQVSSRIDFCPIPIFL